jgi:hypothetical protein
MQPNPRLIVTWVLILSVPVATAVILGGFMLYLPPDVMSEIARNHFVAVVGLPSAAVFSAFLVVALQQTSGPVKFEGLGFKFEGSSGQVVLWVICFLSITVALRLLWSV